MRWGGGDARKTVVGYGLTAALFLFSWIVLGTMLLMNEIFGGADVEPPERESQAGKAA
jgi:hypothetical protein